MSTLALPPLSFDGYNVVDVLCQQTDTLVELHRADYAFLADFHALQPFKTFFSFNSISWAEGFLNVLFAPTPPTIADLVKISTAFSYSNLRGIYLLILEKPHCRSRLYFGSACGDKGIGKRWDDYDNYRQLPSLVELSLGEGYIITHKRAIMVIRHPTYRSNDLMVLYFLNVLEGLFTVWFQAIVTNPFHDGLVAAISPWSIDDFSYEGLCSHSSLLDLAERKCFQDATGCQSVYFHTKMTWSKWKDAIDMKQVRERYASRTSRAIGQWSFDQYSLKDLLEMEEIPQPRFYNGELPFIWLARNIVGVTRVGGETWKGKDFEYYVDPLLQHTRLLATRTWPEELIESRLDAETKRKLRRAHLVK